ncbi:MAG: hypothetical protein ACK4N5_21885, partial [Myxococcales bacterium]
MRYGALDYRTINLGDQIQTLAALRFLPQVDAWIERDALGHYQPATPDPIAVILNGWYGHQPESWPPHEAIRPLLVSMHLSALPGNERTRLSSQDFLLRAPAVEYLRRHGPVGARDLTTLALLRRSGVEAWFSGCMTLTLQRTSDAPRSDEV